MKSIDLTIESLSKAEKIGDQLQSRPSGAARLRLCTLLGKFGHVRRSDSNTGMITAALAAFGVSMHPPIVRFGEDWIYLTLSSSEQQTATPVADPVTKRETDLWFDKIAERELRTEKEVEIKFVVPLLAHLGYEDDDRFDGMPVPAAHVSKGTTLVIDFALFDSTSKTLLHQPLLVVEAKRENRLKSARKF